MFCRCELEYGAAENTHTCPGLPRASRRAARPERARDRDDDPARPRARLRDRRARRLRPQELLLSRPAEGLPDQPVRGSPLRPRPVRSCPTADGEREIGIVRAHLEEDAAKTVHAGGATGRSVGADYSLVDFNRGGTPLLEIVCAPDLRSAEEAMCYLRLLRQTIARARRLRRGHGEGHAPRRRQRLGAARRRGGASGRAGRSRT